MLIDGNDLKINVLILLMKNEIDVTFHTVETLLERLEDGITISILLNGGTSDTLKNLFSGISAIRYYESPDNLGVAGGRNYLLRTEESRNTDIILILDNDVLPPIDYIRNLVTFLFRQNNAGIVGAITADINSGSFGFNIVKKYGDRGIFGNKIFKIESADIRKSFIDLRSEKLFHIGVHPDYHYAYLSILPGCYAIISKVLNKFRIHINKNPFLVHNKSYLELIMKGVEKYEVSNVAGCSQAFRRGLVEEIGYLDEKFNPYGFEDVDFSIRALKAGYKNYIDTNTWLLHGTDSRHKVRDIYKMLTNQYRCKTILSFRVLSNPTRYRFAILTLIFGSFFIELATLQADVFKRLKAKLEGYKKGLDINENKQ